MENSIDLLIEAIKSMTNGSKNLKIGNMNVSISKDSDDNSESIEVRIEQNNNSEVKEKIKNYKEAIEELDDCIFISALEQFSDIYSAKEFNKLLEYDNFTEEEEDYVLEMINHFNNLVRTSIEDKIKELKEIKERF